jgi:dCTP deaminase
MDLLRHHTERMRGIEPPYSAWEADVLPLNYIREAPQASARHKASASLPASKPLTPHGRARASLTRVRLVILSDRTLREQIDAGRIIFDPFDETLIQPSSIDVRISNLFRVFRNHTAGVIDVKQDLTGLTELVEIPADGVFMLHPGEFVLGSTYERIAVPDDLVARIEGKSSLGRLGLLIHSTAGFIDAGFDGHVTLELANVASLPITLYPEMKIGQVSFMKMTTAADKPYGAGASGSKYQGQRGPTPSRYFENFS